MNFNQKTIKLADLIEAGDSDIIIHGLALDSRQCQVGDLFIAIQGETTHGLDFLTHLKPAAVLAEPSKNWSTADIQALAKNNSCPIIMIENLSALVSQIAAKFYQQPSQKMQVIGITGTNGKTSIAHFIAQSLADCAMIGTLGVGKLSQLKYTGMTTPDPISLQRILAELVAQQIEQVAVEVSSHALAQNRTAAVDFDIAIFTNLSRDHLDYHLNMHAYGEAKALLFKSDTLKWAIINTDDSFGRQLIKNLNHQIKAVSYSIEQSPLSQYYIVCEKTTRKDADLIIHFKSYWGNGIIQSPLIGDFNILNLFATLAVLLINQIPLKNAIARLNQIKNAAGRMQSFKIKGQPLVVVDFAHTPDALQKALAALRPYCRGQLYCVFGCGGNRDKGKRALMGESAEKMADKIYLTDDNPRFEESPMIIDDILKGITDKTKVIIIPERKKAIQQAIQQAKPQDVILIAGKGHEDYQQILAKKHPFSDSIEVKKILKD